MSRGGLRPKRSSRAPLERSKTVEESRLIRDHYVLLFREETECYFLLAYRLRLTSETKYYPNLGRILTTEIEAKRQY